MSRVFTSIARFCKVLVLTVDLRSEGKDPRLLAHFGFKTKLYENFRPSRDHVWPLTQYFFLFPFCTKSLICPDHTPRRENTTLFHCSQQLPLLRLGPLKGFLSWHSTLTSCVASGTTEIQWHCQVCRARHGGPMTLSTTADSNPDCAFVENALLCPNPWFWKVNRIE